MKKGIFFILSAVIILAGSAFTSDGRSADHSRPVFDKTGYSGTVWSHANPWFPPNLSRTHLGGGPDYSWWRLSGDNRIMWRQAAEKISTYGLTGLQMEVHIFADGRLGWHNVFESMLDGFEDSGKNVFGMPFVGFLGQDRENAIKGFNQLLPLLQHPRAFKLDGAPVIVVYTSARLEPEGWGRVIEAVESEHGRIVWLFNTWTGSLGEDAEWTREYLEVFDGITQYANWVTRAPGDDKLYCRYAHFKGLEEIRADYPGKIWELAVHHTYFNHFHYGGVDPVLTGKYRTEWDEIFDFNPDAVTVTNFFDKWENSRIFPSYEAEDILMRILQYYSALWRGEVFENVTGQSSIPDIYVANLTSVLLGQPLRFEVICFPYEEKRAGDMVTVYLEICDAQGQVLHSFEPVELELDIMRVAEMEIGSEEFHEHRAVFPRISYVCSRRGDRLTSALFPQTNIVTSVRPHVLYWARSVRRIIRPTSPWGITLDGKGPGDTVTLAENGLAVIEGRGTSSRSGPGAGPQEGGGHVRIMRNSLELESFDKWDINLTKPIRLPSPVSALDWYAFELENSAGGRYTTPPVWVVSGRRGGKVNIPVLLHDGSIRDFMVESVRVPFFHYRCDRDTGRILLDSSGYDHHGLLGGGHLAHTAYRHEHVAPAGVAPLPDDVAAANLPLFTTCEVHEGYLYFNGKSHVMVSGGTAFPYASTFEMYIKPDEIGKLQYIIGSGNQTVEIFLTEEGKIGALRQNGRVTAPEWSFRAEEEKAVIESGTTVPAGEWAHVAFTYDLKEMRLYINGMFEGRASIVPDRHHERMNPVVLGGRCEYPYVAQPSFTGGIRDVRIYGRNLAPGKFLYE